MLWLIDYECAHWCGGQSHCVVKAANEDEARDKAASYMDETMYELFSDQYEEEPEYDDGCYSTVNSVTPFNETCEEWKWFKDPEQSQFFPLVE